MPANPLPRVFLVSVTVLNLLFMVYTIDVVIKLLQGPRFSYQGRDYPEVYVPTNPSPVAMVAEETIHYAISSPEAMEEWATTQVDGGGYLRLGPPRRGFAVSMFHELHCMRLMRYALNGQYSVYARGHMQHCLNYLRQEILCASDVTLEPADILDRDHTMERFGSVHVCKDWEALYEDAEANWKGWLREGHVVGRTSGKATHNH